MSSLKELVTQLPIGDIAKQLGVDSGTAEAAVMHVLPALVGGLGANVEQGGAASIMKAISQHGTALVDGGVSLADVDTVDGEKIVDHVFGDKKPAVVAALGSAPAAAAASPISGELVSKLLPMLAPVVMSFLAQQFVGKQKPGTSVAEAAPSRGLSDVLGGLLSGVTGGGNVASSPAANNPTVLGSVIGALGGLLGGGTK
ncbi:DUF937 domain-containing protein [Plantibacter sp. RU18]|uniref:DUF937 domain-containing protein n=1 Tax=Plantibacter sp. RU18 TaxID=3158143 RepID=UPI003D35D4E3